MANGEIPERWKGRLREHLRETAGEERERLSATDFRPGSQVQLRFQDGSFCLFRAAFYLLDREGKEVAVFTEHCGHHFFPAAGVELELLESARTDLP